MNYLRNNKGQALVEFAVILAFAIFLGITGKDAMYAAGELFEPTKIILSEIDHHRTYDVVPAIAEIEKILDDPEKRKNYEEGNAANKADWRRGMMRSGWIERIESPEDYDKMTEIKNLADEVGASQWSYLSGRAQNYYGQKKYNVVTGKWDKDSHQEQYKKSHNGELDLMYAVNNLNDNAGMYIGDKGLYWTVQDLSKGDLELAEVYDANGKWVKGNEMYNYSKEVVLQYFYSYETKRYYVIKSHVWLNNVDVGNSITLGGLHQHYFKPAGYFVEGCTEGYSTLAQAKEAFERVRAANNYSIVFKVLENGELDVNGNEELGIKADINAGDYVIDYETKKFVLSNGYTANTTN